MKLINSRRNFFFQFGLCLLGGLTNKAFGVQSREHAKEVKQHRTVQEALNQSELSLSLPKTLVNLDHLKALPSAYLVSEKLDGVRAYWDGSALFFRSGRQIQCPSWFTQSFPKFPIDGELWMGRRDFEILSAATRRQHADDNEWRQIKYCLFELPNGTGTYQQRVQDLQNLSQQLQIPWLKVIEQQRFESKEKIHQFFLSLIAAGAEGIVLHQADAIYEGKRSDKIFKFKPYFDAEALVVKHLPGTGKFQNMMGALLVEDRSGKRFRLGSGFDIDHRKLPPPVGTWLTFRYREVTGNGTPRFATFLRQYDPD